MTTTQSRPVDLGEALDAALNGRNYHVDLEAHESWGRTAHILRGYKNEGRNTAIGFVACINATANGYGEWRVYIGHGEQYYAKLTSEIASHGAKLHPSDPQDAAVIAAMFPELPLEHYAA